MRILLNGHQFLPDFRIRMRVLIYSVARNFLARGYEVNVLTAHPADKELIAEGLSANSLKGYFQAIA
jgi:hypothetical protein